MYNSSLVLMALVSCIMAFAYPGIASDAGDVAAEHGQIGNVRTKTALHTTHPDAQWFPDAGLGLFLHWGLSSVKEMNISWPMIPGRPLGEKRIKDTNEVARIVRDMDYQLDGTKPVITPLEYWEMARSFNPTNYHPNVWLKKAKKAGFTYVVLTTKHHEGFALWPSECGNFNTKNFMGGRDLLKDYVEAARAAGLKVGLYYTGPDWYFDKDFMNFLYHRVRRLNPEFPELGPDLKPRAGTHSKEAVTKHHKEYARLVKGQVEELLTRYGKIDLLWFDGSPPIPNGNEVITQERIRELQPGIIINPRLHGKGDFITFERQLPENSGIKEGQWGEFCNPWNGAWPYVPRKYKDLNLVLTDLVRCREGDVNYLLGIGPMADGNLAPEAYENMGKLEQWMQKHGEAVYGTKRLRASEKASVPATRKGNSRYLYMIPGTDELSRGQTVTLTGVRTGPDTVVLLNDGERLSFAYDREVVTVQVPPNRRSKLVDVIKISIPDNH